MISSECALAGEYNAAGDEAQAVKHHEACSAHRPNGPRTTCDCQCVVGQVIMQVSPAGVAERLPEPPRPIQDIQTHHFSELARAYDLGRADTLREVEHMTGYTPRLLGL